MINFYLLQLHVFLQKVFGCFQACSFSICFFFYFPVDIATGDLPKETHLPLVSWFNTMFCFMFGFQPLKQLNTDFWDSKGCEFAPQRQETWCFSLNRSALCRYTDTPPKFNIVTEKWWLGNCFPFGKVTFMGYLSFGDGIIFGFGYLFQFSGSFSCFSTLAGFITFSDRHDQSSTVHPPKVDIQNAAAKATKSWRSSTKKSHQATKAFSKWGVLGRFHRR